MSKPFRYFAYSLCRPTFRSPARPWSVALSEIVARPVYIFIVLLEYDLWIEGICPIGNSDLGLLFTVNIVTFTAARTASELLVNCLQTGNDVIPFSPLGGIAPKILLGIQKDRPRLTISG